MLEVLLNKDIERRLVVSEVFFWSFSDATTVVDCIFIAKVFFVVLVTGRRIFLFCTAGVIERSGPTEIFDFLEKINLLAEQFDVFSGYLC